MDSGNTKKRTSNPCENANTLSAITFWWMLPIFYRGYKRDLEISDIFETMKEHRSEAMGDKLEKAWNREKIRTMKINTDPSLLRVLFQEFGFYIHGFGCIQAFIELVVRIFQPIALGKLVSYYSTNPEDRNTQEAYFYAAIIILCSLIITLTYNPTLMGIYHLSLRINVACCSMMYRKALRLSKAAMSETTVGQIINLMSNDISRMNGACQLFADLYIGPIATVIITVIIYQEIGVGALFGTLYVICYIPFQSWLGKQSSVLRLKTALRTDKRLRLMNEIINGIQVIKMYTWEKPFAALVAIARKKEISQIRATSYIKAINISLKLFTTRTAIFISILAYVLFHNDITATKVFVVTACFNTLKKTMMDVFPLAISRVAEAYISIKRIETFLLYEETKLYLEYQDDNDKERSNLILDNNLYKKEQKTTKTNSILMKNVTAKWDFKSNNNTLSDINLEVVPGRLVAVIGPVGAGKSSLFYAILKELPLSNGTIQMHGMVSYASQEPWLFSASVRQNILFGEPMDKLRYQKVINCCALSTDFSLLPYGDKTIVGERGVSLSGGQKARINLARAVYKSADIYLLDDPLSAVDTHVGKELFDKCINGFLKDKIVILITHQLQYLKEVNQIIILNNGVKEAEGTYNQLKETGLEFAKLLDDQPTEIEEKILVSKRRSSIKSFPSVEDLSMIDPEQVKEQRSVGQVSGTVYKAYLNAAGNKCTIVIVVLFFVLSQVFASASDYFVSYWVNMEEYRSRNNITVSNHTDIWNFSRNSSIYVYSGLILLTILITIARSIIFFNACMKASATLHDNMFTSITRATMRFFNTNTSGRILNRFSKDMGNIDDLLPYVLVDVLQIALTLIGIIVLLAIVNPWLLIPTVIALCIFNFYRIIYISTSRSVKRLEGITSSPVFGHVAASIQGLTTIRAFKAEHIVEKEFDNHQDLHSTVYYLFMAASRTFALWLDVSCVVYMAIVTISFFVFGTEKYGGNVGLALTQVVSMMTIVQWGIRQLSELENNMTSVERVNEYSQIEHERSLDSKPDKRPPADWPKVGRIEFRNIHLTYIPTDPPILNNLSFVIRPKEKVGIVGRTGAGKSSLIAALFQLTETKGAIIIDGLDTKNIGLHDLRSKISIIPQEPVLFSGTLRKNLDPFDEYSDELLWRALEEVELKQVITELAGELNSKMSEGGTNFSVGQRQLVCLARAIVRNNKILVLDEATANVDPQTDTLIQTTIRNKFAECTVLTIAHRLHTVMDSDKILVMDAGTMVEFNHPHLLLQNQNGFLYGMVERTGTAMAETLKLIAQDSYRNHSQQ